MKWAPYITAMVIICAGLGCGTYLALNDHPWFALLAFLIVASVNIKDAP